MNRVYEICYKKNGLIYYMSAEGLENLIEVLTNMSKATDIDELISIK